MKIPIWCITLLMLFGQSILKSQNVNHPTIDKVQASYKAIPSETNSPLSNGRPDIKVLSSTAIILKTTDNITKIHLKMMDAQSKSIVYQVNYSINSAPVTDVNGIKLFYKEGDTIHIGNPTIVSLDLFLYQIQTEDGQGNLSTVFSVTQ